MTTQIPDYINVTKQASFTPCWSSSVLINRTKHDTFWVKLN